MLYYLFRDPAKASRQTLEQRECLRVTGLFTGRDLGNVAAETLAARRAGVTTRLGDIESIAGRACIRRYRILIGSKDSETLAKDPPRVNVPRAEAPGRVRGGMIHNAIHDLW